MDDLYVYKKYLALNLHFYSPDYDFIKYRGAVSASRQSLDARKDRMFFTMLANRVPQSHVIPYFVANLTASPLRSWIGDMVLEFEESCEIFHAWMERAQRLEERLEEDVKRVNEQKEKVDLLNPESGYPEIFLMLSREEISPESYAMLDSVLHFIKYVDKRIEPVYTWMEYNAKYQKLMSFINIPTDRIREIVFQ